MYYVLYTVYYILYTKYYILYTICFTIIYSTLLYSTLRALPKYGERAAGEKREGAEWSAKKISNEYFAYLEYFVYWTRA